MGFNLKIASAGSENIDRRMVASVLATTSWLELVTPESDPHYGEDFFVIAFRYEGETLSGRVDIVDAPGDTEHNTSWLSFRFSSASPPSLMLRFMRSLFKLADELKMQVWIDEQVLDPTDASRALFQLRESGGLVDRLFGQTGIPSDD